MRNKHDFDNKLHEELHKHTEVDSQLKQETWDKIQQELFRAERKPRSKKKSAIAALGTVAAILILTLGLMTNTGQAMIQNLKDMFVEEKQEEIEIEGQKEESDTQLEANEALRYVIYVDEDRYKMVQGEEVDRIETKEPLGERYPDVFMEISRRENTTTEKVLRDIKREIKKDGLEVARQESVTEPIEAEVVQGMGEETTNEAGKTGHQWDTPIHRYYVTETKENQVFVIKQAYFLEAEEGHGARFHYMLESFEIVD
ncbi:hypothetical protein [Oceanobacillus manasiensis]|uniref:hypothetical protein n=1 Tax=Oceanobacillus manasiensis TaxID=586413 RepID=UPI0005A65AA2|nr:hypothetical protein [Oceanobacillus manasiensis]